MNHAPRHKKRGNHRAEIGTAVENTRGQRALPLREPFRHGLDGSGEVSAFADTERTPDEDMHHHRLPHERIGDAE